jgi:VIT1/CCC1 family predicted Fe2+/Mn2+ transporter
MHRIGWLRAAVLSANDGIVSTASLFVGVAASAATFAVARLCRCRRSSLRLAAYASSNFLGRAGHGGDRCNRDAFGVAV